MFLVYFIAQYMTYNTLTYNYYYKTIKIIHNIKNDIFFVMTSYKLHFFVSCLVFILVDSSASVY